jgi:hypothetical protein
MPIKVLIVVIEGDALPPTFTQAPKSGFHMEILAGFVVGYFAAYLSILGCEPWYFKKTAIFTGGCLTSYLVGIQIVHNAC